MAFPTRVWMAQCLCPARHCILAAAGEYAGAEQARVLRDQLEQTVAGMLAADTINPWCQLCQSRDWHYEVAITPYRTMAEAGPHIQATERANRATADLLRRSN